MERKNCFKKRKVESNAELTYQNRKHTKEGMIKST